MYPFNNINNGNYTSLIEGNEFNDIIKKYWIKNKKKIIDYYNKYYNNKSDTDLFNATTNHYNNNNLLYFETLILSLVKRYNSKDVLDIFYTTDKRLTGCLIKGINYTLLLNNKDLKRELKKKYIKELKLEDSKYIFKKSLNLIKKKYSLIFIDTQSKSYNKPQISKYIKYLKINGVIVYSYYKRITDPINKEYHSEIINFNNQNY